MSRRSSAGLLTLQLAARSYRAGGTGPKATLMALVESMGYFADDEEWRCWPSKAYLARETEQSPASVRRHIAQFEELGIVKLRIRGRTGGGRGASEYVLNADVLIELAETSNVHDELLEAEAPSAPNAQSGGSKRSSGDDERAFGPGPLCLIGTDHERVNGKPSSAVAAESGLPAKPTDTDPVKKRAHQLAVLAFEQHPKPTIAVNGKGNAFVAVMGLYEHMLRAGHSVQALESVTRDGVGVWTVNGLARAVAVAKNASAPSRSGAKTQRRIEELRKGAMQ